MTIKIKKKSSYVHSLEVQVIAKLSPHPPNHPPDQQAGKVSGKQDKAIYAKQKLSVFMI